MIALGLGIWALSHKANNPAVGGTEFTWAITGGTGAYSAARGEVAVVESNGGVNSDLQFRITR